ncbi:hypothetical protein NQZ68_012905 [Dissostichus eleginoides]|nr:hypothetical protein NQZ68_012905 [Dissostichus eleginoides]
MRQIHDWVKLCSLCVTKKNCLEFLHQEGREASHPAVTTRSEEGELEELETHLRYPCLLTEGCDLTSEGVEAHSCLCSDSHEQL